MIANELRIGNLVYDFGGNIVPVIRITKDKQPLETPIPLTPEILEMCGFELNSKFIYPDKSIAAKWKKGFYLISEFYTDEGYGIEWIIGGGHSVCPVQIKYLHQLQNLYFALTGEELKINLNVETHQ